ncbi:hypothetical protein PTTG_02173 [Puccinia triticina 1-1 BBBD Race 1]|uniref:Uncharacterized protein n=1 Tax=Puccinia triticina (isolate 1-1 / race 1 (BBBD)) TaxID=630390 RepID=A0A180GE56_PUCT1|nr:hypothetical protein PTTG_02173 [Puccinia triticina 1-1 BBBD Race 1]WAR58229.1 hypothetical protein PtB15_5B461 [Puccinia triticina]
MPSNTSMTPSPKQRNRFISTIRRTLKTRTLSASPTTPPSGKPTLDSRDSHSSSPTSSGSSDLSTPSPSTRSPQPTAQQRRYAAVFSKITFSTAEFIEDRYIYSHSPEKTEAPLTPAPEELVPGPSFFAIPSTRQPSVIDQPDIRLDQTSNPTEHRISFLGLSGLPSSTAPLRSCFQEVFDLIDAGLAGDPFDLIGADISDDSFDLPGTERSDESFDFPGDSTLDDSLDLTGAGSLEQSFHHPEASRSKEAIVPPVASTPQESPDLHLPSVPEEPLDLLRVGSTEECLDFHAPARTDEHDASPEPKLPEETSVDDSIQCFLHSLSASLRNDPTEFSPRISEWDQESANDFAWLHLHDEPELDAHNPLSEYTLTHSRSSEYLTQLPRFLKRSTARAKRLPPKQQI